MTFTAIDFETAHASFPCEIGLTKVDNGVIVDSGSWLIKPACFPYMNYWNQKVHGISTSDVAGSASFEELWGEIKSWIDDSILVAHNAAFDMKVLKESLVFYGLALPYADYFCSVSLSRKVWKQLPSHSLKSVCDFHNINFQHHRAGDDAKACAIITLKAFEALETVNLEEGLKEMGVKLKRFGL